VNVQAKDGHIKRIPDPTLDEPEYYLMLMVKVLQHAYSSIDPTHPFWWCPNAKDTHLEIMSAPPRQLDVVARYPVITVYLGPISDAMRTLDDMAYIEPSTGTKVRVKLRNAYFTFYCIAKTVMEARRLSAHLHTMLSSLTDLLEDEDGFYHFGRLPITENAPSSPGMMVPGDPQGLVMVSLNVSASWMWGYTLSPSEGLPGDRTLAQILNTATEKELPRPGIPTLDAIRVQLDHSAEYATSVRGGGESPRQIVSERRGIADFIIPPMRGPS
jgi:hypothetical protein